MSPDGSPVDAEAKERALALVIPPAWTDVWVCPWPNGHIQAVGTDAAGRRQYLYHPDWQGSRERDKHERVARLARRLPEARTEITRRLRGRGLTRERVGAVALRMLDAGLFRTGGEEYEHDNGSHGVATLLRDHVGTSGDCVTFAFPAKSGVQREAQLRDPLLVKAVRALKRRRDGEPRLLRYVDAAGWHDLTSTDINHDFKELVGDEFTVKDLRTWAATVLAATAFAERADSADSADSASGSASARESRRVEREVMQVVSEHLGNTPAVARGSYVDRRVMEEYAAGRTIARALARASAADRKRLRAGELGEVRNRATLERAVLRLLS